MMERAIPVEFIAAMERGLARGRAKGWKGWDSEWREYGHALSGNILILLLAKFTEEVEELQTLTLDGITERQQLLDEASDVANMAMMLADFQISIDGPGMK